ncbi:MAG: glycosyltransferase [Planctomycetes bacterium]|nr:glycosyltransferase [Planctomycetota bacterium]
MNCVPEVSIVIPIYNEEECLPHLMATLDAFITRFERICEVITVDDGSKDSSMPLLRAAVKTRPWLVVAKLRANRGQTAAMAAGLELARGSIVIFMDADLQNDPADIPRLIAKLDEGYDLVSGWRRRRQDRAFSRKFPSWIANRLIGRFIGVRVHDYGCTLKAYRASILKPLHLYSDMHRFLPALCSSTGARITEIEVKHHPRRHGNSKYGLNRVLKVMGDLLVIKLIVAFADRPMHYFGPFVILFLLFGGATAGMHFINASHGWREQSIVLPALSVLSLICCLYFLFMGLLADLIVRAGRRDARALTRGAAENLR